MKKVLIICFNSLWCPHFGNELELAKIHIDNKDDVYFLTCNKNLKKHCISAGLNPHENICGYCNHILKKGLAVLNINKNKIFPLADVEPINFPEFKSEKELKEYSIDGINLGLGAFSSYISLTRNIYSGKLLNDDLIKKLLHTAYTVYINFKNLLKNHAFDTVYIFNGRYAEHSPIVQLCKKNNIDFILHERGCDKDHYQLVKNDQLHRFDRYKEEINKIWEKETNNELKYTIAEKWFKDRRNKVEQSWYSFTTAQETGKLPSNFDHNQENIAIFNSSIDEYYAFDEWSSIIEKNDNVLIENIIKHYENDRKKHFYLRIHPNLKTIKNTQIAELVELSNKKYKNLTIIWPEEDIDSYALLNECDKVVTFGSTIGIEATYWGKPSILAGKAIYDSLDCVYVANDYDTIFKLIDVPNLQAKDYKNGFPYIFWQATHGIRFNYYHAINLPLGSFLGVNLFENGEKRKINLLQKIFSILNENNHKVLRILGIKFSLRRY